MMRLRLFDIEFKISFLLVSVFALIAVFDRECKLFICFLSAFLHELGHIFAMCKNNCKPKSIICNLFDIKIIDNNRVLTSFKANIIIILSGVIVNFSVAVIVYVLFYFSEIEIFFTVASVNLLMGTFNLLPVSNLDGGQALYLILSRKFSFKTADKTIDVLTILLILPTAVFGFIILFNSKYNFSLLLVSIYLIISLVLKKSKFY